MKDFNNILREKLYNYQKAPAKEVFDNIRENYPKKTVTDFLKQHSIAVSSIATFTIVATISMLFIFNNDKEIQLADNQLPNEADNVVVQHAENQGVDQIEISAEQLSNSKSENNLEISEVQQSENQEFIPINNINTTNSPEINDKGNNQSQTIVNEHKMIVEAVVSKEKNCNTETNKINIPKYSFSISKATCSSANAQIIVTPKNFKAQHYILDDKTINNTGKFNNIAAGIHILQIKFADGCMLYDTLFVSDSLKIKPYFISETDLSNRNRFFFNNQTEIDFKGYEKNKDVEFSWKINNQEVSTDDNLTYEFTKSGSYNVKMTAKLSDQCYREYSEKIDIALSTFKIPNIFTPNGDGVADFFEIKCNNDLSEFNILVFAQSGEKVFESNDINNSWNGKIYGNNDASEGVYYYQITAKDTAGNSLAKKGTIQLVRR